MTANEHKVCYGTMFPSGQPLNIQPSKPGKVFQLEAVTPVGMMPQRRVVRTDLRQWDDCCGCPEFDHCYRLCMAKVSLQDAVGT